MWPVRRSTGPNEPMPTARKGAWARKKATASSTVASGDVVGMRTCLQVVGSRPDAAHELGAASFDAAEHRGPGVARPLQLTADVRRRRTRRRRRGIRGRRSNASAAEPRRRGSRSPRSWSYMSAAVAATAVDVRVNGRRSSRSSSVVIGVRIRIRVRVSIRSRVGVYRRAQSSLRTAPPLWPARWPKREPSPTPPPEEPSFFSISYHLQFIGRRRGRLTVNVCQRR